MRTRHRSSRCRQGYGFSNASSLLASGEGGDSVFASLSPSPLAAATMCAHLLPDAKRMPTLVPKAIIDFETRSACPLRTCGSWKYSLDPTTEVLCLAYRLPYWTRGRTGLWHPGFPHLDILEGDDFNDLAELFRWVMDGKLIGAHHA